MDPSSPLDRCDKGESLDLIENYQKRQQIRRDTVRRLVTANFDASTSRFITLTFKSTDKFNINDVKECNKRFHLFLIRLKRKFPELKMKYLAVIEFQKRGAVHFHMICNIPYIPHKELQAIWGLGFVYINKIDHVDNVGAYVIKYMTKLTDDTRLMGLKGYNCSQGLERSEVMKSWEDHDKVIAYLQSLPKEKVVYCDEYKTERSGRIAYSQVNLNRNSSK